MSRLARYAATAFFGATTIHESAITSPSR